jgi:hypothetical protein
MHQASSDSNHPFPSPQKNVTHTFTQHHPTVTIIFYPKKNITHTFTDANNQKDTWPREDMYHGLE